MPGAAVQIGAAVQTLPIHEIGGAIAARALQLTADRGNS